MKNVLFAALFAAAPLLAFSQNNRVANPNKPQAAHVDYFLKIDGIDGESTDAKCRGCIEIESFSWGATNAGTSAHGSGGGAGKASFSDIHFNTQSGKSTPKLMEAAASGQHIKSAKLFVRKQGGEQQEYLTYKLENVLVSSFSSTRNSGSDTGADKNGGSASGLLWGNGGDGSKSSTAPTDSFSLNFTKITYEWTDASGKVKNLGAGQTPQSVLEKFLKK